MLKKYDNMKVGAASTDLQAVITAFENNYGCMGITAWEVGAVYDTAANKGEGGYLYGNSEKLEATGSAATEPSSSEKNSNALAIGLLGGAVLILIGIFFMMRG